MDEGLVVKGLGGFYFVKKSDGPLVRCKARGRLKKENINKLLVIRLKLLKQLIIHGLLRK